MFNPKQHIARTTQVKYGARHNVLVGCDVARCGVCYGLWLPRLGGVLMGRLTPKADPLLRIHANTPHN